MPPSLPKNMGLLIASVLVVTFAVQPAFGHYLWVTQEGDSYVVARGGMLDRLEPYDPAAVKLIKAFDRQGAEVSVTRIEEGERVFFRPASPPCLAAVRCDWGGRVNTTRGKKLMTRREAEQQGFKVLESFLSTQTSKTLFADGASVCTPLGMIFEWVPIKRPFRLGPGEPLEVKLIFDGAPLKHAAVSLGDNTQTETDEQGVARVAVAKTGWHVMMAKHVVPVSNDADVDYHQYMTFFVFKVKQ